MKTDEQYVAEFVALFEKHLTWNNQRVMDMFRIFTRALTLRWEHMDDHRDEPVGRSMFSSLCRDTFLHGLTRGFGLGQPWIWHRG